MFSFVAMLNAHQAVRSQRPSEEQVLAIETGAAIAQPTSEAENVIEDKDKTRSFVQIIMSFWVHPLRL